MKVKDLDGNISNWKLKGEVVVASDTRPRSKLHVRTRNILRELFSSQIKEEVPIDLAYKTIAYFDFYVPVSKIAIEVHGKQHYEFTPHFHANQLVFRIQKYRDADKKLWCETNGILLAVLPYNEDDDEWRERITRARKGQDADSDGDAESV